MAYIYQITNNINGKIYIGKTIRSILERWKEHLKDYKKRNFEKRPLYDAMNKYGPENFSIKELEECLAEEASEKEIYWIEKLGSFKNGYNATIGGDGKHYIDYDLVCETYKNLQCVEDTAKQLNISNSSVSKILKSYKINIIPNTTTVQNKYGKIINMYDLNDNYLRTFPSTTEAAKFMVENKLTNCKMTTIKHHISEVCKGKRNTAAKFKWKYA